MGPTWSGVRRPYTSLLIIITGARPQAPTQRQESRENFPSAVMAPGEMPSFCYTAARIEAAPFT